MLATAELVLGLLSRDEQAIAAARVASDARFAAEVAAWEEHFGALAGGRRPITTARGLDPHRRRD